MYAFRTLKYLNLTIVNGKGENIRIYVYWWDGGSIGNVAIKATVANEEKKN